MLYIMCKYGTTHLRIWQIFFYQSICYFLFSDTQPVDFKHLLSMGYQRDWLDEQGDKAKDDRAERKVI